MHFVGVDLHKKTISICVIVQEDGKRLVRGRRSFRCAEPESIRDYFSQLRPYQVTVEATASYEWFVRLVEPTADRVVLAHPSKLRVIAESTRKSDKLDAQVLAEFLALDMIPEASRGHRGGNIVGLSCGRWFKVGAEGDMAEKVRASSGENAEIVMGFWEVNHRFGWLLMHLLLTAAQ